MADGSLVVIGGASRCGKTEYVKREVRKAARVIAWDCEDQFSRLPGWVRVTTRAGLSEYAKSKASFKVAYVAGGALAAEFNFWALCVFFAGRHVAPLVCVAEELADVTTPSKAPGNWGILLRRGLKRGITIYAISQRWSEADKTAVGNASEFVLFRQSSLDDVRYLSKKTGLPVDVLSGLKPLQYVKYSPITGRSVRGMVKF